MEDIIPRQIKAEELIYPRAERTLRRGYGACRRVYYTQGFLRGAVSDHS